MMTIGVVRLPMARRPRCGSELPKPADVRPGNVQYVHGRPQDSDENRREERKDTHQTICGHGRRLLGGSLGHHAV
jgi:hypothetical protein